MKSNCKARNAFFKNIFFLEQFPAVLPIFVVACLKKKQGNNKGFSLPSGLGIQEKLKQYYINKHIQFPVRFYLLFLR